MLKEIKNFPGYMITPDGNILGIYGKNLKQFVKRNGYSNVIIYKEGVAYHCYVHRLVAETYISNPMNKPEVNHKDRNKLNNNVDNLEWVTKEENSTHYLNSIPIKPYAGNSKRGKRKGNQSKRLTVGKMRQIILDLPEDYPIRKLIDIIK